MSNPETQTIGWTVTDEDGNVVQSGEATIIKAEPGRDDT